MRPFSIRWFDRLFFAGLALTLPFNALEMWQVFSSKNAVFLLATTLVPYSIDLLLWYLISRRSSNAAKWIWTILHITTLIALPFLSKMAGGDFIGGFMLHGYPGAFMYAGSDLMTIAAAIMLFRSDAANWFASRGEIIDVSIFD